MVLKLLLAMIMKMDGNGMSNNKEIEQKIILINSYLSISRNNERKNGSVKRSFKYEVLKTSGTE